jgi:hypothetical protein
LVISYTCAKAGLFTEDADIISDCLWTISYLADTPDDARIDYYAQTDTLIKVIECMGSTDLSHFVPALRVIGNILSASDSAIIERCLWHGLLERLNSLLYQSNSNIIKECLWAFSNVAAGPCGHIQKFVDSDAFERVLLLTESRNMDIRKEALYVMCHTVTGSDVTLRGKLFQKTNGVILKVLVSGSYLNESRLRMSILDGIEELLKLDEWLGWTHSD